MNVNHHLNSCVLSRYLHLGLLIYIMGDVISFVQIVVSVKGCVDAGPSTMSETEQVPNKEQL